MSRNFSSIPIGCGQRERQVMKVGLVVGSIREGSISRRYAQYVSNHLQSLGCDVLMVDPRGEQLSFPGTSDYESCKTRFQTKTMDCSGFVFVTPEYDGSISSVMKLLIEHFGYPSQLQHKPVGVVGIAGGAVGAVKAVEHLKGILNHIEATVTPGSVSIGTAHKQLNEHLDWSNTQLQSRLDSFLATFLSVANKISD